jgi:hypothetical protein
MEINPSHVFNPDWAPQERPLATKSLTAKMAYSWGEVDSLEAQLRPVEQLAARVVEIGCQSSRMCD